MKASEDLERYGLDLDTANRYADRLRKHIRYVCQAGEQLGVPDEQLEIHDDSKWTRSEFPAYALYFCSNKEDQSPVDSLRTGDDFAAAWLHHIHHNPCRLDGSLYELYRILGYDRLAMETQGDDPCP